jgi:hypothetical protein
MPTLDYRSPGQATSRLPVLGRLSAVSLAIAVLLFFTMIPHGPGNSSFAGALVVSMYGTFLSSFVLSLVGVMNRSSRTTLACLIVALSATSLVLLFVLIVALDR